MFNEVSAMHSLARNYCIDQSNKWKTIYDDLQNNEKKDPGTPYSYSDQDKRTFPRYNILDAICITIEETIPENFKSVDELRNYLILCTQLAESISTNTRDPIQRATIQEERENAKHFFESVKMEDLAAAQLLPFRRTLSIDECCSVETRLEKRWGRWYGGYPESGDEKSALTLHSVFIEISDAILGVREILAQLGNIRIFELREDGIAIEVDLDLANFEYSLSENFWFPADMSWMIYTSHESSITFAGDLLIKKVQERWPNWDKYVYKGYNLNDYDL